MQLRPRPMPRLSRDEFARLVDAHQHRLHVYLAGLVGSAELAFDLVQETFCEAWRAAQKGSPPFVPTAVGDLTPKAGAPPPLPVGEEDRGRGRMPAADEVARWLFRAGSNNALSLLRRARRFRWEPLDGLRDTLTAAGEFEQRVAERDALTAALEALSPQDVACLLLRVVHGFSAAETGAILNTSADNVNNRLARAKQRLRAAYLDTPSRVREARTP